MEQRPSSESQTHSGCRSDNDLRRKPLQSLPDLISKADQQTEAERDKVVPLPTLEQIAERARPERLALLRVNPDLYQQRFAGADIGDHEFEELLPAAEPAEEPDDDCGPVSGD